MVIKLLQYIKMAFLNTVNYVSPAWISLSKKNFTIAEWIIDYLRSDTMRKEAEGMLTEVLSVGALRKWWTLVISVSSSQMTEDHCSHVTWATGHLVPVLQLPLSSSQLAHLLFFSQIPLLALMTSSGKWQCIFNKLTQQLQKRVRKQKIIICSWKDLEALYWSCCPDLNSLLQRQDLVSYEELWFYFFMHLSRPHFVNCQVDLSIHNHFDAVDDSRGWMWSGGVSFSTFD